VRLLIVPHATAVKIRTRAGELARALGELGHQVDVLRHCVPAPGLSTIGKIQWNLREVFGLQQPTPLSERVRAIYIPSCYRIPRLDSILANRGMRRLADGAYDVIHSAAYGRESVPVPRTARFVYDLVDDHADGYRQLGQPDLAARIDEFVRDQIKRADVVTVSALHLQEIVRQRFARDSVYVPNGVNIAAIRASGPRPSSSSAQRVGYMGGLDTYVNIRVVVAALEKLRAAGRNVELDIIGDGEAIRNWTPPAWVRLLGFRPPDEIPTLMQSFAVGLLPFELCSLTDAALPLKVLEHGAARQWVVASPIRELRLQQFPWVLLTPLDADAWAQAVAQALDAPWPANADAVVERFDWRNVAEMLLGAVTASAPVGRERRHE